MTPYQQHPLPGATFEVVATAMFWTVGELETVAMLRATDGTLVAASQPAGCYHPDAPARLYDRDGRWRNSADRAPMTEGQIASLRFTMDWSTARAGLRPEVAALFEANP